MSRERSDCKNCCDHTVQWEYMSKELYVYLGEQRYSDEPDTDMLEDLGALGWELVIVTSKGHAIFKRRVRS